MNNINRKNNATQPQVVQLENDGRVMKIDIKFRRYINTALIIGPMTMIMALVGVTRNYGLNEGWALKCLLTWLTMFPIAYLCAFFIIPIANKITNRIRFTDKLDR